MGEMAFRHWLRRCREQRGLTQAALGELVGYADQTIRKIESGQRRPSPQLAARLAQVLELRPEERAIWMGAARDVPTQMAEMIDSDVSSPLVETVDLPAYLTPFVGRERERADVAALLATPDCRLLTLMGPGGVGKTRLAAEVARQVSGFPDGVAFVPLAAVAVPQMLVPAIGNALGFTFSGTTDLAKQLFGFLREKRLLLVLDTVEHLLDHGGITLELIARLLAQAPQLTLFVTSRERLRLPGEWVVELAGLAVPPTSTAQQTADYSALHLFVELARRVERSFYLSPENKQAVATICHLVSGMPLGIELAAAWIHLLSPAEIAAELARSLDALHLNVGKLPERHFSLRAVVEHSWHLLSDTERATLRRLAVFAGGFSREVAEQVADATLPLLAALADKSLLRRTAHGRYELHEIIRQYAAARLHEDQAEHVATHDRLLAYYADWLAKNERAVKGAGQTEALRAISTEIDNIRLGWQWALNHNRLTDVVRGAETLQWFFVFRGWYQEGATLFQQAAQVLRESAVGGSVEHQRLLGRLLGHYGALASRIGAFAEASEAIAQSLDLLRDSDDLLAQARSCMYQGLVAVQLGDYVLAQRAFAASLALAGGDEWTIAFCQVWGSVAAHGQGAYEEAESLFQAALASYRAMGNLRCVVLCLTLCSSTLIILGKYREVQTLLHEGLVLAATTDDRWGRAMVFQHLGLVALRQEQFGEGVYLFKEALDIVRVLGNPWEIVRVLNHLGAALAANGAATEAEQTYRESLTMALAAQLAPEALQALVGLATLFAQMGRQTAALGLAARVVADPSSRAETYSQAEQLRATLRSQLPAEQAAQIETQACAMSLDKLGV